MKRPFGVTLILVIVLVFTLLNGLRLITAVCGWRTLSGLPLTVPTLYLVVTGTFWVSVGIPLIVGLWVRRKWSLWMAWGVGILYPIFYWIDRLFIASRSAISSRVTFALGVTLFILIGMVCALLLPRTKAYFA